MTRVLDAARDLGYESAVLLGSAGYYSRFGFVSAPRHGIFLFGPNPAKNLPYFLSRELTDESQPWYGVFFEFPAICDVSGVKRKRLTPKTVSDEHDKVAGRRFFRCPTFGRRAARATA